MKRNKTENLVTFLKKNRKSRRSRKSWIVFLLLETITDAINHKSTQLDSMTVEWKMFNTKHVKRQSERNRKYK